MEEFLKSLVVLREAEDKIEAGAIASGQVLGLGYELGTSNKIANAIAKYIADPSDDNFDAIENEL